MPPWPDITAAVPSARDVVVGDVVAEFDPSDLHTEDGGARTEALRVTAVIRGDHEVGELLDTEWLLPNWPWHKSSADTAAIPSCSYLQALPGERIAIAFDALQPGREITTQDNVRWFQPATRYNAMGVLIAKPPPLEGWGEERQRVTLPQLRGLAGLPATDASASPTNESPAGTWWPMLLAGIVAAGITLVHGHRSGDIKRR